MLSKRRDLVGGLALFTLTPARACTGGGAPRIVPPLQLVFPTELPMMAVTSAGVEVMQLGRQFVRFEPVPNRPGRYTTRGASFSAAESIEIPCIGAALFSRDGRWVADVHVTTRTGYPHLSMWAGDTLNLHEAQMPAEIVLSL